MQQIGEPGLITNNINWSPWADKNDMTRFINGKMYHFWPGAESILDELMLIPVAPSETPSCEDIIQGMMPVFDATMTMVLSGEFEYFKLYNDAISTEYYEEILLQDLDRLTYIFMLGCSRTALSLLLHHVEKRFIPQFLKNSLIRPNLQRIINQCRKHIFIKTTMEQEQINYEKLSNLLFQCCQDYMINHKFENMEEAMNEIADIDVPDKAFHIREMVNTLSFFVPDFFIENLAKEDPVMAFSEDPRLEKFTRALARTHHLNKLKDLCYEYSDPKDRKFNSTRIENLYEERRVIQKIASCPELDNMTYTELQIVDRIRKGKITNEDMDIIKNNQKMLNIKAVIDREVDLTDTVDIDDDYITIYKADGSKKVVNYNDPSFKYQYNDAFIRLFGKEEGTVLKQKLFDNIRFNKLETTGITIKELNKYIREGKDFRPQDMTVDDRIRHRKSMIEKLIDKSHISTKLRVFRKTKLGGVEQPKLLYLTANDLLNEMPYILEDKEEILCYKLIELEKLNEFVSNQNHFLYNTMKAEEIERIEETNRSRMQVDRDGAIVFLDPRNKEYITQIPEQYMNMSKDQIIEVLSGEVEKLKIADEERKQRAKASWLNNIPKITNARL